MVSKTRTEWRDIVLSIVPDAIVSHRTAITMRAGKGHDFPGSGLFVPRLSLLTGYYTNGSAGGLSAACAPSDLA